MVFLSNVKRVRNAKFRPPTRKAMRAVWASIRFVGYAAAVSSLFPVLVIAQTSPQPKSDAKSPPATSRDIDSEQRPVAVFRAHTDLVLVPVTVTDTVNRFVLGLQKEDFQLSEDGVQQNVTLFSDEDTPLSVGVIFDESGSMSYKLRTSRDAATQLLTFLDKEDQAFLVEFANSAKVSVPFGGPKENMRSALQNARAGGQTAMLDAIN